MTRALLAILVLAACAPGGRTERYGFLTTLGRDTVALESVTRRGDDVTIDAVDRFPRVRRRHAEVALAPDGAIRTLVMDIHTPSEPANQRERHVEATVTADSVVVTKRDASGTVRRAFATAGGTAMAHVPQMYSLYELYVDAGLRRAERLKVPAGDTVQLRQFYIDRVFDRFPLHRGTVRELPGRRVRVEHDWLAGTGETTVDSAGRLLAWSGAATTYQVESRRLTTPPDVRPVAAAFEAAEARGGMRQLSVRDTMRATIGDAALTVDYGRPLARGRELLGKVMAYDAIWRTGANAATQLTTTAPLTIGDLAVPAGAYTLWTIPHADGSADLVINRQTGQWGTSYDPSRDLGRTRLTTGTPATPVEQLTISVAPVDARRGTLVVEWGNFRWSAPVVVR